MLQTKKTRVQVIDSDKHSYLLCNKINYACKNTMQVNDSGKNVFKYNWPVSYFLVIINFIV